MPAGGKGGLKAGNLHPSLKARLLKDQGTQALNEALQSKTRTSPGNKAVANLYCPANVADGDTITIGAVTFEVDIINTDSGVNTSNDAAGALADSGPTSLVTLGAAPATAISVGDVIRIENELLLVLRKLSTTTYVVYRAYAGTTRAAHAQNLDVFVSNAVPASNTSIPLVTTLTPAVFGPTFEAVFNWTPSAGESRPSRVSSTAIQAAYTCYELEAGQQLLFVATNAGADATATTEEFTNSTDNVWGAATFTGGSAAGVLGSEMQERVPTASEELVGQMHFAFPFTVRSVIVQMVITATGQIATFTGQVHKGYVESTDATLPGTVVTLRNVGAASTAYITGFAATNTVRVLAFE